MDLPTIVNSIKVRVPEGRVGRNGFEGLWQIGIVSQIVIILIVISIGRVTYNTIGGIVVEVETSLHTYLMPIQLGIQPTEDRIILIEGPGGPVELNTSDIFPKVEQFLFPVYQTVVVAIEPVTIGIGVPILFVGIYGQSLGYWIWS